MSAKDNTFSVSELSKASGVSVRTLHYYDEIGLLVPKRSKVNDYRIYTNHHGVLLQQIIVYRNMGMTLEKIKSMVLAKDFNLRQALADQHKLLVTKQAETAKSIQQIEVNMSVLDGEKNLNIIFDGLPKEKVEHLIDTMKQEEFSDEVFQVYGKISTEDMRQEKILLDKWTAEYMQHTNLPVADKRVQKLIKDAYIIMNRMFYRTVEEFSGLKYTSLIKIIEEGRVDKVTVEIYETYQKGLAKHYFDGLMHFAEHELLGNEASYVHLR
ncbi:MAG: MerR family transcriptional regulator [Paraglaciecola sp.]|uniref:MerR family transcriptional regulator n=1 Tax=Paraglaciecola sp. TaxID=1920173 RepID=UPI0032977279